MAKKSIDIATAAAQTIAADFTEVIEIKCEEHDRANIEITNTGATNALTDFKVQALDWSGGTWYDYILGADLDYDVLPTTLAAEGVTHISIPCGGPYAIRLMAKSTATTVTAKGLLTMGGSGSTEANQDLLLAKVPDLGQALATASTPVVLTAAQEAMLEAPAPTATVQEQQSESAKAEGEQDGLSITNWRELRVKDQRQLDLEDCNDKDLVTILGDDTTGLVDSLDHVFGTGAIKFNKANGGDNTKYAGVSKTFGAAINFSEIFEAGGFVGIACKLPAVITDVVNVFIRVGTSAAHYNEWTFPVADLTASEWMALRASTAKPCGYKGNGWNQASVLYVAFGVEFSAETDTLDDILFDNVHLVGGRVTDSIVNNDNSTTQNINQHRIRGNAVTTNSGVKGGGSQRVVIATDDINLAAINAATKVVKNVGIAAKGLALGCTVADTDYSVTVIAEATYLIAALNGTIYLGIDDCTSGNPTKRLWTVPAGVVLTITIPSGTSLHYCSDTALVNGTAAQIVNS